MSNKLTKWHGMDKNKATSLFEFGLLVQYVSKEKKFQVVWQEGYDVTNQPTYGHGWMCEKDIDLFLDQNHIIGHRKIQFLLWAGFAYGGWLQKDFVEKLHDLCLYFGHQCVMGSSIKIHSANEICQWLKIKNPSN